MAKLALLFVFVAGLVVGCSTETVMSQPNAGDPNATPPSVSAPPTVDPALLGEFCSNVSTEDGKVMAFAPVKDCASGAGICVADGRRKVLLGGSERIDTYCTASCEAASCPEAWECVDNGIAGEGLPKRVCVKQEAVCGDGVKQLDEACEDGNAAPNDSCSADCKKVLPAGIHVKSMSGSILSDGGAGGDPPNRLR